MFSCFNRKSAGRLGYWTLIAMLLAVVGFVVVFALATGISGISAPSETLCKTSNRWSTIFSGNSFCTPSNKIIDAKEWDKCNPEFKKNFLNANSEDDRTNWAKHCAAQQVLELAYACYDMGGAGDWDPTSFMCYTFIIRTDSNLEITEDVLANYANEVRDRVIAYVEEKTGAPPNKEFVRRVTELAQQRKIYSMLFDYYVDRVWAEIYECRTDDEVPVMNLTKKIVYENKEAGTTILDQIDTSKEGCSVAVSNIKGHLKELETIEGQINQTDRVIDALAVEYSLPPEVIDANMMATLSGDIDSFSFNQAFLREVAKENKLRGTNVTYSEALDSASTLEILWNIDVTQGRFYEMGYCNPEFLTHLGKGLLDTFICSSFGRNDGHHIQIAFGGGGAGGLLRTGSPYPAYCDYFKVYNRKDALADFLHTPREWCENLITSLTGPGPS